MAKRGKKSKKKQSNVGIDLAVVSMIIISILLVVLIYANSGNVGKVLSPMLGGIMGWIKYILPIGTFTIAIAIACDRKNYLSSKLIQYAVFLTCISSIMCIYQISNGNISLDQEFGNIISDAYKLGEKNIEINYELDKKKYWRRSYWSNSISSYNEFIRCNWGSNFSNRNCLYKFNIYFWSASS